MPRFSLLLAAIAVLLSVAFELFKSSDYIDELHDRVFGPIEGRGLKTIADIKYGNPANDIKVGDLYLPINAGRTLRGRLPCIVLIHGGAWEKGSRHELDIWAQVLASKGFAVFNIDTRLLPSGGGFPRDIVDVRDAVSFISRHAAEYGINPNMISTVGHSSGGHLALMAAYAPYDGKFRSIDYPDCSTRVRAAASVSGVTDLLDPALSDLSVEIIVSYMNQVPRTSANADIFASASPIQYAKRAVPTILIHGTRDKNVPLEQSQRMYDQLTKEKVPSHFLAIDGGGHMYFGRVVRLAMSAIADFLNKETEPAGLTGSQPAQVK
jgi:acetyl esterase/lipase